MRKKTLALRYVALRYGMLENAHQAVTGQTSPLGVGARWHLSSTATDAQLTQRRRQPVRPLTDKVRGFPQFVRRLMISPLRES